MRRRDSPPARAPWSAPPREAAGARERCSGIAHSAMRVPRWSSRISGGRSRSGGHRRSRPGAAAGVRITNASSRATPVPIRVAWAPTVRWRSRRRGCSSGLAARCWNRRWRCGAAERRSPGALRPTHGRRHGHSLGGGVQLPAGRPRDAGGAAARVGAHGRALGGGARGGRPSRRPARGRGVGHDGAGLARVPGPAGEGRRDHDPFEAPAGGDGLSCRNDPRCRWRPPRERRAGPQRERRRSQLRRGPAPEPRDRRRHPVRGQDVSPRHRLARGPTPRGCRDASVSFRRCPSSPKSKRSSATSVPPSSAASSAESR